MHIWRVSADGVSVRLIGFKYLRQRRILALALVVATSSMLFSVTALILLSFYRGFTSYLGEAEDIVAVYDRGSRTPFTGLVPLYLSERLSVLSGVLASSPEVVAPCIVNGGSAFLRGIVPEEFVKLNKLTIVEGSMINLDDLSYVVVGRDAARRLHIGVNDRVIVLGVLTDRCLELQVKGVFVSYSPMDDEVLAPLYVGQWLRGTDYSYVTLIRFKIDRSITNPHKIFEEIAGEAYKPSQSSSPTLSQEAVRIIPRVIVGFKAENIGVDEAYSFMRSYMERYGVTRESLLIISVMVFLFSSISVDAASKTILAQHRGEINVLRSIGVSRRLLKRDMLIKLLPWSIASSSMGFSLAVAVLTVIQEGSYLQALSHKAPLQIDLSTIALNIILASLLVSVSILRSGLE
jgi:ABC-type lipoprotein release transport system permease subunit